MSYPLWRISRKEKLCLPFVVVGVLLLLSLFLTLFLGANGQKKAWSYAHLDSLLATVQHLFILKVLIYASPQIGMVELGRLCMLI